MSLTLPHVVYTKKNVLETCSVRNLLYQAALTGDVRP